MYEAWTVNENRAQVSQDFAKWATELWAKYAQMGNHYIKPSQAEHSFERGFMGENIDYYIALYSREDFQSLSDFWLYNAFIDPIHYQILEGSELEWEAIITELSDKSLATLYETHPKGFTGHDEIKEVFAKKAWLMPRSCAWIHDLDIIQGRVSVGSDALECLAETEQGFLTIFVLID